LVYLFCSSQKPEDRPCADEVLKNELVSRIDSHAEMELQVILPLKNKIEKLIKENEILKNESVELKNKISVLEKKNIEIENENTELKRKNTELENINSRKSFLFLLILFFIYLFKKH
jgi:predicted RNase H-like nuclease (RuvC/YqgF family)